MNIQSLEANKQINFQKARIGKNSKLVSKKIHERSGIDRKLIENSGQRSSDSQVNFWKKIWSWLQQPLGGSNYRTRYYNFSD